MKRLPCRITPRLLTAILMSIPLFAGHPARASLAQRAVIARAPAGSVNIYRDRWGMAHIYAAREEDGYYGLGYASGQDRLKEVLLAYLAVRGDLAAAFGPGPLREGIAKGMPSPIPDTVAWDKFALRGRYLHDARENFPKLPAQMQKDFRAYIAGLREFMHEHPAQVPSWAPTLEPALPAAYYSMATTARFGLGACAGSIPKTASARVDPPSGLKGSDAWVLSRNRSEDDAVIFGSDSHGPITAFGSLFYSWVMDAGPIHVYGVDISGMMVPLFGHTNYYAWGWTEGLRYVADCYAVKMLPGSARSFRYDGETRHMLSVPYDIRVKGRPDVRGHFDYTRFNGVLSPVVAKRGDVDYVSSSAYAGTAGFSYVAFRLLTLARNFPEVKGAIRTRELYPANFFIGGRDGTTLYIQPGRVPIRALNWRRGTALDGNTSETMWRGYIRYRDMLKLKNPPEGYLSNENISPDMMFPSSVLKPKNYPAYFGFQPGKTDTRQRRIIQLFNRTGKFSITRAEAVIFDDLLLDTTDWTSALKMAVANSPRYMEDKGPNFAKFVKQVERFDGHVGPQSQTALAFVEMREALKAIPARRLRILVKAVHAKAPLTKSEGHELLQAAARARNRLMREFGTWHLAFGDVYYSGRGGIRSPARGIEFYGAGDEATLSATVYAPPGPHGRRRQIGGTRNPFLVEFTTPIRSYSASYYGMSDNPGSPHYSDQSILLTRARLKSNYFTAAQLCNNVRSERTLHVDIGH